MDKLRTFREELEYIIKLVWFSKLSETEAVDKIEELFKMHQKEELKKARIKNGKNT